MNPKDAPRWWSTCASRVIVSNIAQNARGRGARPLFEHFCKQLVFRLEEMANTHDYFREREEGAPYITLVFSTSLVIFSILPAIA